MQPRETETETEHAGDGNIAHPGEGEQEESLESEETLSPDELGEDGG